MSFRASQAAMNLAGDLNLSARLVAIALAYHHNETTGRCDPSVATLAQECGMDERTTRRAIRELETIGLVETIRNGGGSAYTPECYRSNSYVLRFASPGTVPSPGMTPSPGVMPPGGNGDIPGGHLRHSGGASRPPEQERTGMNAGGSSLDDDEHRPPEIAPAVWRQLAPDERAVFVPITAVDDEEF